jgi:hypothetical protein
MSEGAVNVNELFEDALSAGDISQATFDVLQAHDLGADINAAIGVSVDDLGAGESVFVTIILDDSASIDFGGNTQLVMDGYNLIIDSLRDAKVRDNILVHCVMLNGGVLHPFCSLDNAVKLDRNNYQPDNGTPLYETCTKTLATILAKWQDYTNNGVDARTITAIITDGAANGYGRVEDVASMVRDMLSMEQHIIAGIGIKDGVTDFKEVFNEMGIVNDKWILTPENTAQEIRQAFRVVSSSAVRASQSALSFSQTNAGGFGI